LNVLVVEDDVAIAEPLVAGLRHHGFAVTSVDTGTGAMELLQRAQFDVVLLDLGLPDMDGLDLCKRIRATCVTPIVMVTARGDEVDRVVGLELGADDYVVKPFGVRELVARIRAVHRRASAGPGDLDATMAAAMPPNFGTEGATCSIPPDQSVCLGELKIDYRTHRAFLNEVELSLTPKEFGVLKVLSADPGAVVTRSSLIEQVWDEHWYGPTKTLDVHIVQLRQKLGNSRWIETVRSVGYRLNDPTRP
jgi:two-component system, OmpR family, response regulator RegX3